MFAAPIFLGLAVYLLLTAAFPLDHFPRDFPHGLNGSSIAGNILNSRTTIVDLTADDYLTLLSAPFDVDNPNPVSKGFQYDDASSGQGTTIFVIDSGFNLERIPEEQCLDQRKIQTYLVPRVLRAAPLTDAEQQVGLYYPPDNSQWIPSYQEYLLPSNHVGTPDTNPTYLISLILVTPADDIYAPVPKDGRITGHGTAVAILAAGCKTGVARKANLFLIKMIDAKMKAGLVQGEVSSPAAQQAAMQIVGDAIEGSVPDVSVPRGKAVLVMCTGNWRDDDMQRQHGANWDTTKANIKAALDRLDRLGVTVVMSASNYGASPDGPQDPSFTPRYLDQSFPQLLATPDSPITVVGATNNKGQLSPFSTPGRGNTAISVYAQGEAVLTYDLLVSGQELKSGTSYSTPIVAGLAASVLSGPSNPCPYNPTPFVGEDSVGMCVKNFLMRTAFQRVDPDNLLSKDPSEYKYPIPSSIPVVSNGAVADVFPDGGGGESPPNGPSPCWSEDTREQCKMMNITGTWFEN